MSAFNPWMGILTTILSISYERKSGKVHFVQYIDKPLHDELERQEKKNPTRHKH